MSIAAIVGADPAEIDIEAYPGEDIDFTVPVLDGHGDTQDLVNWTVAAQARVARSLPILHTFTLAITGGGVRVTATSAETAAWANWSVVVARWDIWATPPSGKKAPLVIGWVRVRSAVTH